MVNFYPWSIRPATARGFNIFHVHVPNKEIKNPSWRPGSWRWLECVSMHYQVMYRTRSMLTYTMWSGEQWSVSFVCPSQRSRCNLRKMVFFVPLSPKPGPMVNNCLESYWEILTAGDFLRRFDESMIWNFAWWMKKGLSVLIKILYWSTSWLRI